LLRGGMKKMLINQMASDAFGEPIFILMSQFLVSGITENS